MPGLYKRLEKIGDKLCCATHRETLTLLSEYMDDSINKEEELSEMPGYGEYHEYGKRIEYEKKYKRKPHRTPDSVANQQTTIRFEPDDVPDLPELKDWEGEHRQREEQPEGMPRPFDQEW